MDTENISSPVDPDPTSPTPTESETINEVNDDVIASSNHSHHDDTVDDDDIDSILQQNQRFIEEHSIDPYLPDLGNKIEDLKEEEEENEEKPCLVSEVLEEEIVLKENDNQLHSVNVNEEIAKESESFEISREAESTHTHLLDSGEELLKTEGDKTFAISQETTSRKSHQLDLDEILDSKDHDTLDQTEDTKLHQLNSMAEQDTSFAPCAECKYRWSKIVDTSSSDIGFYPSYSKGDPILLSWDSALKAYYSVDQKIVCGDYHGNLVVDGNVFPVEVFNVRSYTFEVDLFIKDDMIEEDAKPANSVDQHSVEDVKNDDSKMDNSLKVESSPSMSNPVVDKTEVTAQSTEDFINSVTSSLKFESLTKRHSPVGDDATKSYSEFSPIDNGNDEPVSKPWNSHEKAKDDTDRKTTSRMSKQSSTQNELVDDIIGDTSAQDLSRMSTNSIRSQLSEERDVRSHRSSSGPSPVHLLSHNSARESPSTEIVYRRPPSTSDRYSPARSGRPGSDVDGYDKGDQRAASSSLSRNTPTRNLTPTNSRPQSETSFGRERILENGDHSSSNRPPSHPSSRHSSNHSSRAQSLSSITSEQELGQYMGHGSRSSSLDRCGPSGANGHGDDYHSPSTRHRDSDRPTSVPCYPQQQQNSDVRSMTPDNRIRIPQSPDFPALREGVSSNRLEADCRSLDRASVMSNASSRTITPSLLERETFSPQVKDLEDTVANLRKLLTKREAEVHSLNSKISDLKDINRSLKDDLEHAKRHRPGTSEDTILELKQTTAEKEILATEVVSLRDELQRMRMGSGRRSTSSEISDYSPNNPTVLQRKIVDLESHMRDLQEAHESSTTKLGKAENKIRSLQDENKDLKSRSLSIADLQEVGGHTLRVEMVTLREDLRSLKERNFQLTEENMRLNESVKSTGLGGHIENKLNSSFRSDDGVLRNQQNSQYRDKNYTSSYSNYSESRSALPSQYKTSREDLAPKDLRHSYTSERKHHDSNSRPLLQRESVEQSRLRYMPKKDNIHPLEASKSSALYPDRSRPDGEISEKLQSQRLSDVSSYDKKYLSSDKSSRLHSNIHDFRPRDYSKEDRMGDRLMADKYSAEVPERDYQSRSSGSALNSKEIFYNLKQKRANQWLTQVDSRQQSQVTLNVSTDSDNTDTLVTITSLDGRPMNYIKVNGVYDKYVSGNLEGQRPIGHRDSPRGLYADDVADDSDTATDILLAQESGPRETSHIRVHSPNESISSLSDDENGDSNRLRRRSKSVEFRRSQEGSSTRLIRSGSATRPLNSLDSSRNSSGLRSVLPTPLATQHNKSSMNSGSSLLLNSTLTQGMRPFAPCNPSDVRSGDVVKFSRVGGKLTQGAVKYVGHLPGRSDAYLGVELDKDEGKHDGTFEGIRYFKCKPSKGVFVAFNKIVMAWAP